MTGRSCGDVSTTKNFGSSPSEELGGAAGRTPSAGTVLIVDDDPDLRTLIRALLEAETQLECAEAADAFHALEAWHANHHDVVLLDHRIPGMHGFEVARVLLDEDPQ